MDRLEAYSWQKGAESRTSETHSKDAQTSNSNRQHTAGAQSQQDMQIVLDFRASRKAFLYAALRMFGKALSFSDRYEDSVFRFCSLWLGNSSDVTITEIFQESAIRIASHKFIVLVHQVSARLASNSTVSSPSDAAFQSSLFELVSRLCVEHPYHSLFQVLFLREPAHVGKAGKRRSSAVTSDIFSQANRSEAASGIMSNLRKSDHLRLIIRHLEAAIAAYIDWALYKVDKNQKAKLKPVPREQKLLKLKNLPIPVSTVSLELDKACRYDPANMPCIQGFKPFFSTAGGVHLPKITDCIASDGKTYKQLVRSY